MQNNIYDDIRNDPNLGKTFIDNMKLCRNDIEIYSSFIKQYTDVESNRYDPNILDNFLNNYISINKVIFSIKKTLENNSDIVESFEKNTDREQAIFLIYKKKQQFEIFRKYIDNIKKEIILYFYNLYLIHEPIIDDFYKNCLTEKYNSQMNDGRVAIVTPEQSQSISNQRRVAWGETSDQENSDQLIDYIKRKIGNIPSRYNIPAPSHPRRLTQMNPEIAARLNVATETYDGGKNNKITKRRSNRRTRRRTK